MKDNLSFYKSCFAADLDFEFTSYCEWILDRADSWPYLLDNYMISHQMDLILQHEIPESVEPAIKYLKRVFDIYKVDLIIFCS